MPPPIQSDLEKAAKMANCHNFATSFQEGYDTKTGEKGVCPHIRGHPCLMLF
eukprot:m.199754 g.199754  ORF g.199754 m.199754 type:complete len:52 (-) comp15729_c0_seq9:2011-2166(-)